jgi:3-hydroxyacyl-CoA dehydrogenase
VSDVIIRKAAVIGAGTMGSGIAAHLANAGLEVVLLDLDAAVAHGGVERQLKAGGFMMPQFAQRITTGSTGADIGLLADCDWIIEAVAERLDIKHTLFAAIDKVRKPTAIVSSNTSTIPLHDLLQPFSDAFAGHFLIAHFFNPPRHMRLLELVSGPRTLTSTTAIIRDFCDERLGKGVVPCKDTPGLSATASAVIGWPWGWMRRSRPASRWKWPMRPSASRSAFPKPASSGFTT